MEVLIYIAGALVTFAVILLIVDRGDISLVDHVGLAFGFAGVWPIIWLFLFVAAIIWLVGQCIERVASWLTNHC